MVNIQEGSNKFYVEDDAHNIIAEITFTERGEDLVVNHTYVSPTLRGQGVAMELVKRMVDYARREEKKVIPTCSYARKAMVEDIKCDDILKGMY